MRSVVFGSGYVGLVTGACLADGGHHVVCVDVDAERVAALDRGEVPIWEPGLDELLARVRRPGGLEFTTDAPAALACAEAAFIAVGTPQGPDGAADLRFVDAVARTIGAHAVGELLVVDKSTVPVGTAARVQGIVDAELDRRFPRPEDWFPAPDLARPRVSVCSNPEFLKEGSAVADFKHGERIVIGTSCGRDERILREIYAPFNRQHEKIIAMDIASAELTKYAANAMLATRISFMNEIAAVAEATGADVEKVRVGVGSDPRIGYPFLYAGSGYGGSCFPKDVAALAHLAEASGCAPRILSAVEAVNRHQKTVLFRKLSALLPDLAGRTVAVWGLSFKPRTDDVREAVSLTLVPALLEAGARIRAYDPVARETFSAALGGPRSGLELVGSKDEAVQGAEALVVCTEWDEFRVFDPNALKSRMTGTVVVDGRNLWDPERLAAAGFAYASIGRATVGRATVGRAISDGARTRREEGRVRAH